MRRRLANAIIGGALVLGGVVGTTAAHTVNDAYRAVRAPAAQVVTTHSAAEREYVVCEHAEHLADLTAKGYDEFVAAGSPGDYVTWAKANGFPYEDFGGRAVGGCIAP